MKEGYERPTIEPLVADCSKCQSSITHRKKRPLETEEQRRTDRRLRLLAAKGCPVCHGTSFEVTESGERVLAALRPLLQIAVAREVSDQLRGMGFATLGEERVDLAELANLGRGG